MNRDEYIKRAWNALAIKIGSEVEGQHDNIWANIDEYIKTAIEEAYDKGADEGYDLGHDEGYNEGFSDGYDSGINDQFAS